MDQIETKQEINQITIEDLKAIMRLIDVVSKRGAIQPIEMSGVGMLYEKLANFVIHSEKDNKSD